MHNWLVKSAGKFNSSKNRKDPSHFNNSFPLISIQTYSFFVTLRMVLGVGTGFFRLKVPDSESVWPFFLDGVEFIEILEAVFIDKFEAAMFCTVSPLCGDLKRLFRDFIIRLW